MSDSAPGNKNLLLPNNSNSMTVPISTAQKLSNVGSATGNPRNKCALKPGHSLMHWIRLGNSGVDLSGTRGRVVPVSHEELSKHNTENDAWLAIRGSVYNVSRYMGFHPGGVAELMRGVGKDATRLFDEVHAWVNYQQLLAKCYIGPLQNVITLDADLLQSFEKKKSNKAVLPVKAITVVPEIVPRLDWLQQKNQITFSVYTRQFCNPGLLLLRQADNALRLRVFIENLQHLIDLQLQANVQWPPQWAKIATETGKIEISFKKSADAAELWTTYGTHTMSKLLSSEQDETFEFEIVKKTDFNHDSFEISLCSAVQMIMLPPLGYHVSIEAMLSDESTLRRSYTPVQAQFLQQQTQTVENPANKTNLHFLLKTYKDGLLSSHLSRLQQGAKLALSTPRGNFKLQHLLAHRRLAFLAAGSGLTPFLNLIEHLLQRNNNKIEHLLLMYFNKTEADIWCQQYLTQLQAKDDRFQFVNILSQVNDDTNWQGLKGRISPTLLASLANKNAVEYATFVGICGPNAFNQITVNILKELQFDSNQMHIFQS